MRTETRDEHIARAFSDKKLAYIQREYQLTDFNDQDWKDGTLTGWYDWWMQTGTWSRDDPPLLEILNPRDIHMLLAIVDRFWNTTRAELFLFLHGRPWPSIKQHLETELLKPKETIRCDTTDATVMYDAWYESLSDEYAGDEQEADESMENVIRDFLQDWQDAGSPPDALYVLIKGRAFTEVMELANCWYTLNVATPIIKEESDEE